MEYVEVKVLVGSPSVGSILLAGVPIQKCMI